MGATSSYLHEKATDKKTDEKANPAQSEWMRARQTPCRTATSLQVSYHQGTSNIARHATAHTGKAATVGEASAFHLASEEGPVLGSSLGNVPCTAMTL